MIIRNQKSSRNDISEACHEVVNNLHDELQRLRNIENARQERALAAIGTVVLSPSKGPSNPYSVTGTGNAAGSSTSNASTSALFHSRTKESIGGSSNINKTSSSSSSMTASNSSSTLYDSGRRRSSSRGGSASESEPADLRSSRSTSRKSKRPQQLIHQQNPKSRNLSTSHVSNISKTPESMYTVHDCSKPIFKPTINSSKKSSSSSSKRSSNNSVTAGDVKVSIAAVNVDVDDYLNSKRSHRDNYDHYIRRRSRSKSRSKSRSNHNDEDYVSDVNDVNDVDDFNDDGDASSSSSYSSRHSIGHSEQRTRTDGVVSIDKVLDQFEMTRPGISHEKMEEKGKQVINRLHAVEDTNHELQRALHNVRRKLDRKHEDYDDLVAEYQQFKLKSQSEKEAVTAELREMTTKFNKADAEYRETLATLRNGQARFEAASLQAEKVEKWKKLYDEKKILCEEQQKVIDRKQQHDGEKSRLRDKVVHLVMQQNQLYMLLNQHRSDLPQSILNFMDAADAQDVITHDVEFDSDSEDEQARQRRRKVMRHITQSVKEFKNMKQLQQIQQQMLSPQKQLQLQNKKRSIYAEQKQKSESKRKAAWKKVFARDIKPAVSIPDNNGVSRSSKLHSNTDSSTYTCSTFTSREKRNGNRPSNASIKAKLRAMEEKLKQERRAHQAEIKYREEALELALDITKQEEILKKRT
jgi:hypothetical protein